MDREAAVTTVLEPRPATWHQAAMLLALSIRDFAIIETLDLDLGPGLTVITGETGAGKSVLIDALNLVLGGRARTEVVRTGADEARVEALFDLRDTPGARERLAQAGLDAGDELVVRRIVSKSGRHKVYLNGNLATVNTLAQITGGLVDISGQHEHYSLLRPEAHLELLDRVAGLSALRDQVEAAHQGVAVLDARIADLRARQRNRADREDFLRFQLEELDRARLEDPGEEEQLDREARRLGNVEKLRQFAASAEEELYGAKGAAAERLARAVRHVERLIEMDTELAPLLDDLNSALAIAEDAGRTLGSYGRDLNAEPDRLEQVQDRLGLFARLRRKYGASLAEVIERQDEMLAELDELAGGEDALSELVKDRLRAADALGGAADKLTAARRAGGDALLTQVTAGLADLGMGGARLAVDLSAITSGVEVGDRFVGPRGADRVEFLLSANPGEQPQPLNRIASGGELSRFMLAVKGVIAARDPVATYVFDEVDAGVGGPTADAIGQKLRAVSASRQALCITHLPQIAAMGDTHWYVSKAVQDDRTHARVSTLDRAGRVAELARMLGGAKVTKTTRAAAEEMLDSRQAG